MFEVRLAPSEIHAMTIDEIVRLTGRSVDYLKRKRSA